MRPPFRNNAQHSQQTQFSVAVIHGYSLLDPFNCSVKYLRYSVRIYRTGCARSVIPEALIETLIKLEVTLHHRPPSLLRQCQINGYTLHRLLNSEPFQS